MLDIQSVQANALGFDVATVAYNGAREHQQDQLVSSFPLGQQTGFAILADGMGTDEAGTTASTLAMSEMFTQLKLKEELLEDGVLSIPATLRESLAVVNQRLADHVETDADNAGMGSTLMATMIRNDQLFWLSVGEAPLFLFRDGVLRQLNNDQETSGAEIGAINCPERPHALQRDDIVIAASDGVRCLPHAVIASTLKVAQRGHAIEIADALLAMLRQSDEPDQDNAALVVIKLNDGMRDGLALDGAGLSKAAKTDHVDPRMGPIARQLAQAIRREKPAEVMPKLSVIANAQVAAEEIPLRWYRAQRSLKD